MEEDINNKKLIALFYGYRNYDEFEKDTEKRGNTGTIKCCIINIFNKLDRLQKENAELKKGQNSLMQSRKKWKSRYYKLKNKLLEEEK